MSRFLALALLSWMGHAGVMAEETFYVGTMTDHSSSKGIYVGRLDTETGNLGPLRLAADVRDPNFVAPSPDGKFLYAAICTVNGSSVIAYRIRSDGTLVLLNERPSSGEGACYVSVDVTGRHVLVANYEGGDIACFGTRTDGSLDKRTAFFAFHGSGPDPDRQRKPYAHSIYVDPENRFVYSCDLGSDTVWIFRLDAEKGTLTPVEPPGKVPPGSGPRHLAFHPTENFVYVANEMGHTITVFARDPKSGRLTAEQEISTLAPGTSEEKQITVAEVACHPSGKWLYVSNRGCDTISQFSIGADGKLTLADSVPSVVDFPRNFALDPMGRWMIVAGQKDNRITVFRVDPETGRLMPTGRVANVPVPVCVKFAVKKV